MNASPALSPKGAIASPDAENGDRSLAKTSVDQPPWGMYVILAALVALVAVSIVAVLHYQKAADAVTALGPITAVIVGLVGTFFGVRGATLAQQKANEAANNERTAKNQ